MKIQRKLKLLIVVTAAAVLSATAFGDWQSDYERGLRAASENDWATARDSFMSAASQRAQDSKDPTSLPGPVTEPRQWRGGSPYSPNFAAAYAAYRMGKATTDESEKQQYLILAAAELRSLVENGQAAPDTLKVLGATYQLLGDKESATGLKSISPNWKVDTAFLANEDQAAPAPRNNNSNGSTTTAGGATITTNNSGGQIIKIKPSDLGNIAAIFGDEPVATLDSKFALIIGNTKSPEPGNEVPFAGNDAEMLSAALSQYAGYSAANVTTLVNATADQIRQAVSALASTIPNDATLLIYFTGQAAHLGGQDYIAGNDVEFATDSSKMVEKSALLQPFISKGAKVFFFAQCSRAFSGSDYFGKERMVQGTFSESYATIPGSQITSVFKEGKQVGLYTASFIKTLREFYTNQVPITEFCWQVFYTMRGGTDSSLQRGGGTQTPTLPILTNLGPTSPF